MADSESTFRFGLTGWPITFSLSPLIHTEFFRTTGMSGEYLSYPVSPGEFGALITGLFADGVTGLNVTYPHKVAAAGICDEVSDDAGELKAVNTLKAADGYIAGFNTDIYGFNEYVDCQDLPEPFFIVGSGGVARAIDYVMRERHLRYNFFCRNPGDWRGFSPAFQLDELEDSLEQTVGGTVINATVLGWKDDDLFPVDKTVLEGRVFADLNYNRSWRWRNGLKQQNTKICTGEVMLVHQAARSFEIWTGIMPETAGVLAIVRKKLSGFKEGL